MPDTSLYFIREANREDQKFVFNSWYKSYANFWPLRPWFSGGGEIVLNNAYYATHGAYIRDIIRRSTTLILAPRGEDDPYTICGWVIYEGCTVHYVYIPKIVRLQGLAWHMLDQARGVEFCSHMTTRGAHLAKRLKLKYRPQRIWPVTNTKMDMKPPKVSLVANVY